MFRVDGAREGRPVTVEWHDGELDGDPAAIAIVEGLVERGARVYLVPVGPFDVAGLQPAWRALLTVLTALDPGAEVVEEDEGAGLWPPGAELPGGAIA